MLIQSDSERHTSYKDLVYTRSSPNGIEVKALDWRSEGRRLETGASLCFEASKDLVKTFAPRRPRTGDLQVSIFSDGSID